MSQEELVTAQNLIRDLRAELYSTRNAQKEAKAQAESMRIQFTSLQDNLQQERQKANRVSSLESSLKEKQRLLDTLLSEVKDLRGGRHKLEDELRQEKLKLEKAEYSRDKAEAERLRVHRLRDETAHKLLEAESRIQDLEDEQSRLEDAHHAELSTYRNDSETPRSQSLAQGFSDTNLAHQELELERQRAEGLSFALEELRRERDQLTLKLREIQALNPVQETQKEETKISETLENLEMKEDISEKEEKVLNDTLKQKTEELQKRVNQLGAVRNKLMQELDLQVEETERLATENASITQAMLNARKIGNAWEAQTNDCLIQIDKLKDMLEESALWQNNSDNSLSETSEGVQGRSNLPEGGQTNITKSPDDPQKTLEVLQEQLMLAKSRATELDLHLRGLTTELTRQIGVTEDLKNWNLPLLTNVEKQLQSIVKMTAPNVFTPQILG